VANTIETRLAVDIEPIVICDIERAKSFTSLCRSLSQVLVEHLFPTLGVQFGGVGYHTVEVEKNRIVSVARDHMRCLFAHRVPPETWGPNPSEARSRFSQPVHHCSS